MVIKYISKDLLKADADAILHQVNCQGVMGSGVALHIRKAFPEVYNLYKRFCSSHSYLLGKVFAAKVNPSHNSKIKVVFNLFAQDNYGYDGKCYTNYEALEKSLYTVKQYKYSIIALPYKMGCCRGGGDWDTVYNIIAKVFQDTDTEILICKLDAINSFKDEYAFLSNFYPASVSFDGITYQNSEAAFQAQKTSSYEERKQFALLPPNEAKRLGRRISLRPDWEEVKDDLMYRICYAKFSQNKDLKKQLLETGNQPLEEGNNWKDTYWGTVNGIGKNKLGEILMRIRKELSDG